jgi:hypothetical protein
MAFVSGSAFAAIESLFVALGADDKHAAAVAH